MQKAKTEHVAVGLLANKTQQQADSGVGIVQIGAFHEYGLGDLPQRSFLRTPFNVKNQELNQYIKIQYNKVLNKQISVEKALNLIGIKARNIVIDAFDAGGFGLWPELKPATIKDKGSSTILIDTGALRNSITWEVRS